jgi:hypothetical protein
MGFHRSEIFATVLERFVITRLGWGAGVHRHHAQPMPHRNKHYCGCDWRDEHDHCTAIKGKKVRHEAWRQSNKKCRDSVYTCLEALILHIMQRREIRPDSLVLTPPPVKTGAPTGRPGCQFHTNKNQDETGNCAGHAQSPLLHEMVRP